MLDYVGILFFFFFKQKTADEMRIGDWSSDVCSSDLVGAGTAFVTGYYEPEIAASRDKRPGYDVPIYRRPADLVEVDFGQFADDLKGRKIRGRVEDGKFVRYYDRAAIESGALEGRGLEIAWAADAAEFFFQIGRAHV